MSNMEEKTARQLAREQLFNPTKWKENFISITDYPDKGAMADFWLFRIKIAQESLIDEIKLLFVENQDFDREKDSWNRAIEEVLKIVRNN